MTDQSEMGSKYKNSHQKVSTDTLRNKLRQKYKTTLQESRDKNIDSRRFPNSSSNAKSHIGVKSMQDLREIFMDNKELRYHISPDEMDKIFREVEQEFSMRKNEEINLPETEIEAIINNLLHDCLLCGEYNDNLICASCANAFFSDGS